MPTFTEIADFLADQPLALFGAVAVIAVAGWLYANAGATRATRARRPARRARPARVSRRDDGEPTVLLDRSTVLDDLSAPMASSAGAVMDAPLDAPLDAPPDAPPRRERPAPTARNRPGRDVKTPAMPGLRLPPPRTELSDVRFTDVAGADEAVEELTEIKEYLLDPERFRSLGAVLPKGVLLVGPPGTGKTLLTKALAGEAGVPYQVVSAASLVEVYVGLGAARVHQVFAQARKAAPSIVFIDELDAIGRVRAQVGLGGQEERESTLNQLLIEMDGFDSAESSVLVIGATNRPDVLDPALLRPGRFDRRLIIDAPDLDGRRAILAVHSRNKPLAPDADLAAIARRTIGFTGADLANVMNEAALLAARRGRDQIGMVQLDEAVDRVMAGPERRSRVISEQEKRVVAYHESGHVLASWVLGHQDVHKVSIVSRGRSHGYTLALPTEDRILFSHSDLAGQLAVLLGGRAAEELVFGEPTTGAEDDLRRATRIAHKMVTDYGMSERVGPVRVAPDPEATGGYMPALSGADVMADVDSEVRRLVREGHERVAEILRCHRAVLDNLAQRLLEAETLSREELEAVLGPVARAA